MLNYPVKLEKLFLGVFSFNFIMLISGSNIGGDSHLFGGGAAADTGATPSR